MGGTVLGVFDQGKSLLEVSQLALDLGLAPLTRHDLATKVYQNVIGSDPSPAFVDLLVGYMDGRSASFSRAQFMAVVAELEANQSQVGLVGLQQSGLEFV